MRFLRWVLALALLPSVWALFKSTYTLFTHVAKLGYQSWWLYLVGAVAYLIFERWIHKPMWFYVVGHELTHAVSGLLSGAKIYSIKANSKKGEVRLSKSNVFVALSPYVIPFYALDLLLTYWIIQFWWQDPRLTMGFQLLLGASLAFHVSFTWDSVHRHQPDLKTVGLFLSTVLIFMGNLLILSILTISLFKNTPSLAAYGTGVLIETINVWQRLLSWIH